MKMQWEKFYRPYLSNMNILKKKYDGQDNHNKMTKDILNYFRGTAKL